MCSGNADEPYLCTIKMRRHAYIGGGGEGMTPATCDHGLSRKSLKGKNPPTYELMSWKVKKKVTRIRRRFKELLLLLLEPACLVYHTDEIMAMSYYIV